MEGVGVRGWGLGEEGKGRGGCGGVYSKDTSLLQSSCHLNQICELHLPSINTEQGNIKLLK